MACCLPFGSLGSTTVCGQGKEDKNTQRKRKEKSCQRLVRAHHDQDKRRTHSHHPPGSAYLRAQPEEGHTNAMRRERNAYRLGVTGGLTCTHTKSNPSQAKQKQRPTTHEQQHRRVRARSRSASASSYKTHPQTDNHGMQAPTRAAHKDRSAQRVKPTYRRPTTCRPPAPCACGTPPGTRGPSRACP